MIIHALQTGTPVVYEILRIGYFIRSKCTLDKYSLFKWSTRLQRMYNHMVRWTASVISISLLFLTPWVTSVNSRQRARIGVKCPAAIDILFNIVPVCVYMRKYSKNIRYLKYMFIQKHLQSSPQSLKHLWRP